MVAMWQPANVETCLHVLSLWRLGSALLGPALEGQQREFGTLHHICCLVLLAILASLLDRANPDWFKGHPRYTFRACGQAGLAQGLLALPSLATAIAVATRSWWWHQAARLLVLSSFQVLLWYGATAAFPRGSQALPTAAHSKHDSSNAGNTSINSNSSSAASGARSGASGARSGGMRPLFGSRHRGAGWLLTWLYLSAVAGGVLAAAASAAGGRSAIVPGLVSQFFASLWADINSAAHEAAAAMRAGVGVGSPGGGGALPLLDERLHSGARMPPPSFGDSQTSGAASCGGGTATAGGSVLAAGAAEAADAGANGADRRVSTGGQQRSASEQRVPPAPATAVPRGGTPAAASPVTAGGGGLPSMAAATIADALRPLYERLRNEDVPALLQQQQSPQQQAVRGTFSGLEAGGGGGPAAGGGDRPSGSKTPRFIRRLSIGGLNSSTPAAAAASMTAAGPGGAGAGGPQQQGEPVLAFRGLRVRVGLHSGVRAAEVVSKALAADGGVGVADFTGDVVAICKEVSDAAMGGMVVLSGSAFRALQLLSRKSRAPEAMLLHLGEHVIKPPAQGLEDRPSRSGAQPDPQPATRELYAAVFPALACRLALLPSPVRTHSELVPGCLSAPAGLVAPVFCNVVGVEALLAWEALVQERLMRAAAVASAVNLAACRPLGGAGEVASLETAVGGVGMVREALDLFGDMAQEAASRHGGYVVASSADGGHWVLVFGCAEAAVGWGLDMLQAMLTAEWPDGFLEHELTEEAWEGGVLIERGLRLRIGVDYGRAMVRLVPRSGRLDYVGRPMNRAARIAAKAKAASVLMSGAAWSAARPALGSGVAATNLGTMQLKGVKEQLELWEVRTCGTGDAEHYVE